MYVSVCLYIAKFASSYYAKTTTLDLEDVSTMLLIFSNYIPKYQNSYLTGYDRCHPLYGALVRHSHDIECCGLHITILISVEEESLGCDMMSCWNTACEDLSQILD